VSVQFGAEPAVVATIVPGTTRYDLELLAPIGAQTFTVKTYDGAGAAGNVLSQGSALATIVEGGTNSVPLTLNGVVATLALSVADTTPAIGGGSFTKPLAFAAQDAAGRTIVGDFDAPVALEVTGNTTAFGLTATSLTRSDSAVSYTYDGAGVTAATLRPVMSTGGTSVTLSPLVEVTGIEITTLKPAALVGGSLPLSATVTYSNGTTNHAATWTFSGTGATMSGATLSGLAVGAGTATATATGPSDTAKTATAAVRVFDLSTVVTPPLLPGLPISVLANVTAPLGSTGLQYQWRQTSGLTGLLSALTSALTLFTPPSSTEAPYELKIEVTDADGYQVEKRVDLIVSALLAVDKTSLTFLSTGTPQTITLPNGATVASVTSSSSAVVTATGVGTGAVTVTAVGGGAATLTITATDGRHVDVPVSVTTTSFAVD
jgi:hypothetical protein